MAHRVATAVFANRTAGNLLPVMDPQFNLREICKQMTLLEDHLIQPRKRCNDCITKHFLMIEGLYEEAASLDSLGKWTSQIEGKADLMRQLLSKVLDGDAYLEAAKALRELRKALMPDARALRLASRWFVEHS